MAQPIIFVFYCVWIKQKKFNHFLSTICSSYSPHTFILSVVNGDTSHLSRLQQIDVPVRLLHELGMRAGTLPKFGGSVSVHGPLGVTAPIGARLTDGLAFGDVG